MSNAANQNGSGLEQQVKKSQEVCYIFDSPYFYLPFFLYPLHSNLFLFNACCKNFFFLRLRVNVHKYYFITYIRVNQLFLHFPCVKRFVDLNHCRVDCDVQLCNGGNQFREQQTSCRDAFSHCFFVYKFYMIKWNRYNAQLRKKSICLRGRKQLFCC